MTPFSPSRTLASTAAALAALLLVAGCASAPDRYYTLATPGGGVGAAAAAATAPSAVPLFIELAPLAMPERLARPQMLVHRAGGGSDSAEVALLEQHRWSSSFENELRDALASGIAARLGAIDATKGGRQAGQPAWRIAVQLQQFDAFENDRVDAVFGWTVRRSDAERSAACQWSVSEPVGAGIDALAQGAQRVTARAAEAMARHVASLQTDAAAPCRTP